MKMKKIKITIVLVFILAASCKKEFVELDPISTVNIDVLFKTDKDFQDAVVGAYSILRVQGPNIWNFSDLPGDDTEQQFLTSVSQVSIDNFTVNINDNLLINSWRNYYNLVSRCNLILSRLESADASVITNKDR